MMGEALPEVECDSCGTSRTGQPGTTHDDLRQMLEQVGWLCDKARDTDLCAYCVGRRYGTV